MNRIELPADHGFSKISDALTEELIRIARSSGASEARVISPAAIVVEDALADLCRDPQCPNYGLAPSCPPHVSGPVGFRILQKEAGQALVLRITVPSAALFSSERGEIMRLLHEASSAVERAAIRTGFTGSKAFAGGSCKTIFCPDQEACRVLSQGDACRHPEHARPSMSGFGVNVGELMKACGWPADRATREPKAASDAMSWVAGLVLLIG